MVVLALGCSQAPTPTPSPTQAQWSLDVEGQDAKAIPVEVIDTSGLVVAAEPGGRVPFPDVVGRSTVVGIDDNQKQLSIGWTANACATGATIVLQSGGGVLGVDVAVDSPGGCDLLGYDYGILLDLAGPIGDRIVIVSQSDADARTWGAALLGSDGRRRPLLVVDRSGRVESVRPMDPARLDPGAEDVVVRPGDGPASVVASWVGDACDDVVEVGVDLAGSTTRVRINLANQGNQPCVGLRRVEGLALTFDRPIALETIDAQLVIRH